MIELADAHLNLKSYKKNENSSSWGHWHGG
jgi:hypothetical protein